MSLTNDCSLARDDAKLLECDVFFASGRVLAALAGALRDFDAAGGGWKVRRLLDVAALDTRVRSGDVTVATGSVLAVVFEVGSGIFRAGAAGACASRCADGDWSAIM